MGDLTMQQSKRGERNIDLRKNHMQKRRKRVICSRISELDVEKYGEMEALWDFSGICRDPETRKTVYKGSRYYSNEQCLKEIYIDMGKGVTKTFRLK